MRQSTILPYINKLFNKNMFVELRQIVYFYWIAIKFVGRDQKNKRQDERKRKKKNMDPETKMRHDTHWTISIPSIRNPSKCNWAYEIHAKELLCVVVLTHSKQYGSIPR